MLLFFFLKNHLNTIPDAPKSPDLKGQNADLIEEPSNLTLILRDSTKDQEKMRKNQHKNEVQGRNQERIPNPKKI